MAVRFERRPMQGDDNFIGPRLSDTMWAQMKMIAVGAPCQHCGIEEGVILRRDLRWCRTCARIDGIVQRQARDGGGR